MSAWAHRHAAAICMVTVLVVLAAGLFGTSTWGPGR